MTNSPENTIVKMMIFSVGEQDYGLPVLSVREIREFETVRALPFASQHVCGVMNLRGTIITVIDLATYLHITAQPDNNRRIVIIVEGSHGFIRGLLVDHVIDMVDIDLNTVQMPSNSRQTSLDGLITIDDNRMIGILRADIIINSTDEAFPDQPDSEGFFSKSLSAATA